MKRISLILLLLVAHAAAAQTNTGVIEGRVVRSGKTDPVPTALVTLTPAVASGLSPEAAAALAQQAENLRRSSLIVGTSVEAAQPAVASFLANAGAAPGTPLFVLTDSGGHFTFRDLPSGRYTLRAERENWVGPTIHNLTLTGFETSVTLERDRRLAPLEAPLTPTGILSGVVRDPLGNVVANVAVGVHRAIYSEGREVWAAGRSVTTNDRGEYRFPAVAPGYLWVGVTPRQDGSQSLERTFFGDVTTRETATRVTIIPGEETANINVNIQRRSGPVYKITGTATNPLASPNPATGAIDRSVSTFILAERKTSLLSPRANVSNAVPVNARPNGEFEIRDVRPGSYDLIATAPDPTTRQPLMASVPVEVKASDVTGISLAISQGVPLSGEVQIRGSRASTLKPESLTVLFQSLGPGPAGVAVKPEDSGRFSSPRIAESPYRVVVNGVPANAYIPDIRETNRSIFDNGFTLDSRTGRIQVLIETEGQTVTGLVKTTNGQPATGAMVALIPPEGQRQNTARYRNGLTDETGRFTIRGVPPGRYTAYAWESINSSAWMNEKYVAKYENRGRPVTVGTATSGDLELTVIAAEARGW